MTRAMLLAGAMALMATTSAGAAATVAPTFGRDAPDRAAAMSWIDARTRPDQAGDLYSFRSETEIKEKGADGDYSQTNAQTFDLQVLAADAAGVKLRYTLREVKVSDSSHARLQEAASAAIGLPLDFTLSADGEVTGLSNWAAYKAQYLKKLGAALPADDPVRAALTATYKEAPLEVARQLVLGDVLAMAAVEVSGRTPLGLTEVGDDGRSLSPRFASLDLSVGKEACRLANTRTARTGGEEPSEVTATASLSVVDGRVLDMVQTKRSETKDAASDETLSIRRLSDAPGCGG